MKEKIEKSVLTLRDVLGKLYYKATYRIPAFSFQRTMVFDNRDQAYDWLSSFTI